MEAASISDLRRALEGKGAALIGIDGYLGAGKTTIATSLSVQTGYACLHLDDYLHREKGTFVDNLDLSALERAARGKRPLIIEGLCLLEVFERLQIRADFLVYVRGATPRRTDIDSKVFTETDEYLQTYRPLTRADVIFNMDKFNSNSSTEVDIAYIKSKTAIAMVLAIGGILSILVGALVFVLGVQGGDSALIKIAGAELSAKGIGGVILITSAAWAYLAYLARPQYSQKREIRESTKSDGSTERHEFQSSTQAGVRPGENA